MISMKRILKIGALYLVCVLAIGAGVYFAIAVYAQKTLYLDKKQWRPAEPKKNAGMSLGQSGIII